MRTQVEPKTGEPTEHHIRMHLQDPLKLSESKLDRNFRFAEITLAFLLGFVLDKTSSTVKIELDLGMFRAVLLGIALLLITEMYIVLLRYHGRLGVRYDTRLLLFDVGIGFGLMTIIDLIVPEGKYTVANRYDHLHPALLLASCGFFILCLRQLVSYQCIPNRLEVIERGGRELKKNLYVPIAANIGGGAVAILAANSVADPNRRYIGITTLQWSWIGLGAFICYFGIMYLYKPDVGIGDGFVGNSPDPK